MGRLSANFTTIRFKNPWKLAFPFLSRHFEMVLHTCRNQMLWDASCASATPMIPDARSKPSILSTPESGVWRFDQWKANLCSVSDKCSVVSSYFLYLDKRLSVSAVQPVSEYSVILCPLFKQPQTSTRESVLEWASPPWVHQWETKLNVPGKRSLNTKALPVLPLITTDPPLRKFGQDLGNNLCDVHVIPEKSMTATVFSLCDLQQDDIPETILLVDGWFVDIFWSLPQLLTPGS